MSDQAGEKPSAKPGARRKPGAAATRALATRAALIQLAEELFSEQGYLQSSIRDIARRGGVTSGAIYGHFRNKADLLVAAINTRMAEELESQSMGITDEPDYVETITRLSADYTKRRRLRSLIVQGAAASLTDPETRDRLREEQLSHLNTWVEGYERDREQLKIHPSVELRTAVLYTWAAEVGLGVLESIGIEPKSRKAWGDMANRFARSMQLPADTEERPKPRPRR